MYNDIDALEEGSRDYLTIRNLYNKYKLNSFKNKYNKLNSKENKDKTDHYKMYDLSNKIVKHAEKLKDIHDTKRDILKEKMSKLKDLHEKKMNDLNTEAKVNRLSSMDAEREHKEQSNAPMSISSAKQHYLTGIKNKLSDTLKIAKDATKQGLEKTKYTFKKYNINYNDDKEEDKVKDYKKTIDEYKSKAKAHIYKSTGSVSN